MKESALVLFSRCLDYAGMFPPAALPFTEAVQRYRAMLAGPERFLLARFVCPVARLEEVEALRPSAGAPPTVLAVLGTTVPSLEELREQTVQARRAMSRWLGGGELAVDQFEVALPRAVFEDGAAAVAEAARVVCESLAAPRRMLVALEVPVAGSPAALVHEAAKGIAQANQESPATPVCLKLRCGGANAAAVPSLAELANALAAARDCGVLVKATQGLHHAVRHWDAQLGAPVHGFVNLFAAAALARSHGLDADGIAEVLAEEDPSNFVWTPSALAWRDRPVSLEGLAAARRFGVSSFGSCSVDEPLADLRRLGLVD